MNYLWSLVHALQVFHFLLYLNIEFPQNLISFAQYLQVASGEIEEFQQFIPDILGFFIDYDTIQEDWDVLQERFIEGGIETPYVMISYSKGFTLVLFVTLVTLPFIYLLHKVCRR